MYAGSYQQNTYERQKWRQFFLTCLEMMLRRSFVIWPHYRLLSYLVDVVIRSDYLSNEIYQTLFF